MICGNCGASNAPENEYCAACGSALSSRLKVHDNVCANHPGRLATGVCSVCGLELCELCERFVDDAIYCEECLGRPSELEELEDEEEPVEPVVLPTFAGLDCRLMAGFLDGVVFGGGALALDGILAIASRDMFLPGKPGHPWFLVYWLITSAWALVYLVCTVGVWEQTPGMSVMDLKVIREDGRRIGWGLSMFRFLALIPSLLLVFGILMPLWDAKRRMWHDKITHTMVVKVGIVD